MSEEVTKSIRLANSVGTQTPANDTRLCYLWDEHEVDSFTGCGTELYNFCLLYYRDDVKSLRKQVKLIEQLLGIIHAVRKSQRTGYKCKFSMKLIRNILDNFDPELFPHARPKNVKMAQETLRELQDLMDLVEAKIGQQNETKKV